MANGDLLALDLNRLSYKLLDGATASANGVWVEVGAKFNICSFWTDLTAETSGSPIIAIMVSNAVTKPADATDGPIVLTLAGSGTVLLQGTVMSAHRWVKAKKTAGGTPVATVCILEAARNQ